jgi:hypothetical protein
MGLHATLRNDAVIALFMASADSNWHSQNISCYHAEKSNRLGTGLQNKCASKSQSQIYSKLCDSDGIDHRLFNDCTNWAAYLA